MINPNTNTYAIDHNLKVQITVDETFDNDHRVVNKRENHSGRFTFSAADAGQHRICFLAETDVSTSGWMSSGQGAVKVTLDIAIGETSKIETEDKDKMKDIVQRVRDLNSRLHDIRREQVYQRVRLAWHLPLVVFRDDRDSSHPRKCPPVLIISIFLQEREAEFRDQSETTNSRVVRWTMIQLAVLSAACAWQLSHLRSFFIKQKLT